MAQTKIVRKGQGRRKRRARMKKMLLVMVLLALLVTGIRLAGNLAAGFGNSGNGGEVSAPEKLEDSEVRQRLQQLAEQYEDYREIYEHMDEYPIKLLAALCNNEEMLDFVKGYLDSDGSVTGGFSLLELAEEHPVILQWDKRWGYAPYGDSDIGMAGCAPTCLSMVILQLTKDSSATPDKVADYAMENGYYLEGTGTAWSLMTEGGIAFQVEGEEIPLDEGRIDQALSQGHPVVLSLRPGDFTTEGHFIVLVEKQDGGYVVRDPNSRVRSQKLWDYGTLEPQIKNLWEFQRIS